MTLSCVRHDSLLDGLPLERPFMMTIAFITLNYFYYFKQ